MATITNEQIEQKKQLLAEKVKEMKTIFDELAEAGAIELSDEELDAIAGGGKVGDWFKGVWGKIVDAFTKPDSGHGMNPQVSF